MDFKKKIYLLFGFVAFIWIIELINWTLGHKLCQWGIYPRSLNGLIGIPLSPFLHNGLAHTMLNTIPLIILGSLIIIQGNIFFKLSLFIIIVGGLLVWLFGRTSFHVGASGLIYGYFGFLVAYGWYGKNLSSVVIGFITLFIYSGIIWGALPITKAYISWEGHLFGLVAGVLGARFSLNV